MEENNAVVTSVNPEASGKRKIFLIIGLIIALAAIVWALMAFTKKDGEYTSKINDAGTKFDAGDVNGSITDLEAYLKSNISDSVRAGTLLSLASAYAQKGSLEFKEAEYSKKAIDAVNESLKLSPNVSEAYRVMAYAYEIAQDYTNAIPNYEKAINLDQSNAIAYSGLGHAYDLMGDLEKAKTNYEKALSINANLDHAQYNLAKVLFRLGKNDEAKKMIISTINSTSNNRFKAEALLLLGVLLADEKQFAESIIEIEKSIETDPKLANAYVALGQVKLASVSPTVLGIGGFLEKKDGVMSSVLELANQALQVNPTLTSAMMMKAQILFLQDKKSEAIDVLISAEVNVDADITLGEGEKKIMRENIQFDINRYQI